MGNLKGVIKMGLKNIKQKNKCLGFSCAIIVITITIVLAIVKPELILDDF